ncbi:MAG: rod shape-determining protein MreC, partial [Alphaproteobacteria bacterium]|nr:rod shape-determining protein MreC [Alphaproteobacteria bacterium]
RFSFVLFLALALGRLVLGRSKPVVLEHVRARVMDGMTPVLGAMARPMTAIETAARRVTDYFQLQSENERLRAENAQMAQWQNAALALENENRELRSLLNYKTEPQVAYISARVIADAGGPFVRSLVVTAGREDGAREGMAAMTGEGLIGRVVEVGEWSSRILLITDLNSRIPVTVTGSGEHAILAGDNAPKPKLLYLPQDAVLQPGVRVMTSGHGGVFPPDLPVGVVTSTERGVYEITPLASLGRINQVRLIDFHLKGGAFNPMTDRIEASAASH